MHALRTYTSGLTPSASICSSSASACWNLPARSHAEMDGGRVRDRVGRDARLAHERQQPQRLLPLPGAGARRDGRRE
eukprot:1780743-Prymnesium_polylepis.1